VRAAFLWLVRHATTGQGRPHPRLPLSALWWEAEPPYGARRSAQGRQGCWDQARGLVLPGPRGALRRRSPHRVQGRRAGRPDHHPVPPRRSPVRSTTTPRRSPPVPDGGVTRGGCARDLQARPGRQHRGGAGGQPGPTCWGRCGRSRRSWSGRWTAAGRPATCWRRRPEPTMFVLGATGRCGRRSSWRPS
jgi:hypothetical protein